MLNGHYEGMKALGYLYKLDTKTYLCGVALVNLRTVIADGSCIPEGTDISEIYAILGQLPNYDKVQVRHVSMPIYIREEENNVTLVVFFVSSSTRKRCLTSYPV